jgi:hypothetical protein
VSVRIVKDGQDPLTKPALDYVTGLGVPANLIRRIELDSPHGDVQTVRVTLMVDTKEPKPVGFEVP